MYNVTRPHRYCYRFGEREERIDTLGNDTKEDFLVSMKIDQNIFTYFGFRLCL